MSTLELENIKHPDNSGNNLTLASDGSVSKIHVKSGDAGSVSASPQADDLVVEASTEAGITLISPDDQSARIRFTSPSTDAGDVGGATIFYRQNINKMSIGTEVAGGQLTLKSGAGAENLKINALGYVTAPSQPSFYVYASGGGIASSNSYTTPGFDNVSHNIGNHWDTSTVTFTAPVAGLYYFHFAMYWNSTNGYSRLRILKNSSTIHHYNIRPGLSGDHSQEVSGIIGMAANDTVKPQMQSDQSNSYFRAQNHTYFEGYLLG